MQAKQYISFFKGDRNKAISYLEKSISLYEKSPLPQTPKTVKRIQDYKNLLIEIKSI